MSHSENKKYLIGLSQKWTILDQSGQPWVKVDDPYGWELTWLKVDGHILNWTIHLFSFRCSLSFVNILDRPISRCNITGPSTLALKTAQFGPRTSTFARLFTFRIVYFHPFGPSTLDLTLLTEGSRQLKVDGHLANRTVQKTENGR